MVENWNHNIAYHPWILQNSQGRVLDIGCGDGTLVEKLAAQCEYVVGIEPDCATFLQAKKRLENAENVQLLRTTFEDYAQTVSAGEFETIIFVASIHHMDFRQALENAKHQLCPGGIILIVGLSANKTIFDWIISSLKFPIVKILDWKHRLSDSPSVPVVEPTLNLAEIREIVSEELPGATIRHGVLYRYLLSWVNDP